LEEISKPIPKDFLQSFLTDSFCAVIGWCAEQKMEFSPKETANYFITFIS
jgi:hypothetical protein